MKNRRNWLLALIALVLVCIYLSPLGLLALIALGFQTGFGHPLHPPLIAGDVPVAGYSGGPRWNAIVQQHFAPGTKVQTMLVVLRDQGFSINPARHVASYDWGGMPCLFTVNVNWTEDPAQHIATIKGGAYSGCL